MELIKWNDSYLLGIEEIDNQHKGLVIIINELFNYMSEGRAKKNLTDVFDHLTEYTELHFGAEEMMLVKYAYPDYDQHKLEHEKFIDKLNSFKADFKSGKITISLEVLNFLKDWLINHIMHTDKKYSEHIKKHS